MKITRLIYLLLRALSFQKQQKVTRKGIHYHLDISEGIDLSLFLFGAYQDYISSTLEIKASDDPIIIDVGANIGSVSLNFAQKIKDGNGQIISFEPTDYAHQKLIKNIEANPDLGRKITIIKSFVSSEVSNSPQIDAYSS